MRQANNYSNNKREKRPFKINERFGRGRVNENNVEASVKNSVHLKFPFHIVSIRLIDFEGSYEASPPNFSLRIPANKNEIIIHVVTVYSALVLRLNKLCPLSIVPL